MTERKKIKNRLSNYNNKLVKIIDTNDKIYEGIGYYNNGLYNFQEFGREEESIQILGFNFYKSSIKKIKEINEYSSPYSELELDLVKDLSLLEEVLFDDEEEKTVLRVLACLEQNTDFLNKDLCKMFKKKCKTCHDKETKKYIKKVLKQK